MTEQNQKLRVGVIGLGMGRAHIQAYKADPTCEVVALCDVQESRLIKVAGEFGIARTFTDTEALFASGELDVVSVATPNRFHAPLTIRALDAGVHVLCEKPMAMNAGEAKQMLDAAARNKRKLAIHFNHRMNPAVQWIGRAAQAGELGELYFARTFWHRRRGIPARPSFLSMENAGGGALIDLGVHMMDQTLFILGHPKVTSVTAQVYTKFDKVDVPHIPMDVDDFAVAFVRFDNGATMEMEISWASHHDHPEEFAVQVYGTDGGARRVTRDYQLVEASISSRRHGAMVTTRMDKAPSDVVSVQSDLLAAIREDREPVCSGHHGYVAMQILDAIYESSRTGREVMVSG
jgi:predicted dehydrogenase